MILWSLFFFYSSCSRKRREIYEINSYYYAAQGKNTITTDRSLLSCLCDTFSGEVSVFFEDFHDTRGLLVVKDAIIEPQRRSLMCGATSSHKMMHWKRRRERRCQIPHNRGGVCGVIIFTVVARSPSSEQEHHYCDHHGMSKTTFITHLKAIKIQFPTWKMPIRVRGERRRGRCCQMGQI